MTDKQINELKSGKKTPEVKKPIQNNIQEKFNLN